MPTKIPAMNFGLSVTPLRDFAFVLEHIVSLSQRLYQKLIVAFKEKALESCAFVAVDLR